MVKFTFRVRLIATLPVESKTNLNLNNRKERVTPLFCWKIINKFVDITITQFLKKCKFAKYTAHLSSFKAAFQEFFHLHLHSLLKEGIIMGNEFRKGTIDFHLAVHPIRPIVPYIQSKILTRGLGFANLLSIRTALLPALPQFVSPRFPPNLEWH